MRNNFNGSSGQQPKISNINQQELLSLNSTVSFLYNKFLSIWCQNDKRTGKIYIWRKIDEMWINKFGKEKNKGDLIEAYKIMTGKEAISAHKFFEVSMESRTRGHEYKLYIVISKFLQRSQKQSRGNQLIHSRLSWTKSIGSGSNPESGRQTVRRLWWMVFGAETWREVGGRGQNQDRICWRAVFSVWNERAV